MSPIAFHRRIYTSVRLNPPTISVSAATTSDPTTAIGYSGNINLSGLATVTWPGTTGIGTLGYEWRDGDTVVGVGSTTTLYDLKDPPDGGKVIEQFAIYYPDPTRTGIQTFEPAAINSPFKMGTVVLNVKPLITITQHPDAVGQGSSVSSASFTVSPALPSGSTTIDLADGSAFTSFASDQVYALTPNGTFAVTIVLDGGAGRGSTSGDAGNEGGMGGNVKGDVTFDSDVIYQLVVGAGDGRGGGAGNGGTGGSSDGMGGGGFTGLFKTSVTQANAILIAGGGGAAAQGNYRPGNDGGGLNGGGYQGTSGTQTGSNSAWSPAIAGKGSELQGGNAVDMTNDGGGGGGGYWGGSAGRGDSNFSPGPYGGGGGSGYIQSDDDVAVVENSSWGNVTNTGGGKASFKIVA